MFIDTINALNWEDTKQTILAKTKEDVIAALQSKRRNINDFMALISPAATPFIEEMAAESHRLTERRFGKTIQMYVPLYLSNFCTNNCVYCGFGTHNKIKRCILSDEEIEQEAIAIRKLGFEHILLVTGEAEKKADVNYLAHAMDIIKPHMSQISIEVQPLKEEEYSTLIDHGLNSVYVYQETYNQAEYPKYHLSGKKADFKYRLDTYERLGRAGVHKMGLGILAGLEDWRTDSFCTALHLQYLQKKYWKTKYSISFPRIRPNSGHFQPNSIMTDTDLAQLIFAYRLFDENVEIALSTRENENYRNHIMKLGVTSMSAESKTTPGGYANPEHSKDLEQFAISDERTAKEMAESIRNLGYEVVWKDWDLGMQK